MLVPSRLWDESHASAQKGLNTIRQGQIAKLASYERELL